MFSKKWQRRSALFLLIAYGVDLALKLADWGETFGVLPWWGIVLGLSFRFAFMGGVLYLYLRLRKPSDGTQTVTAEVKRASDRSVHMIHRIFFVVIFMYIALAEWLFKTETAVSFFVVISFYLTAAAVVAIVYTIRSKLLRSATIAMERNPNDAEALGRLRGRDILGMVTAVSVSLFGLAIRALGGSRPMAWPFFAASMVLMFILRPRREDFAGGTP